MIRVEGYVKFKQTNQIPQLLTLANRSTLNKTHVIEIKKACTVVFMKARNSLVVQYRKKHVNWKKTEDGENLFFKVLGNRFWLTSKSYSWFNKVVHGRPSIKRIL